MMRLCRIPLITVISPASSCAPSASREQARGARWRATARSSACLTSRLAIASASTASPQLLRPVGRSGWKPCPHRHHLHVGCARGDRDRRFRQPVARRPHLYRNRRFQRQTADQLHAAGAFARHPQRSHSAPVRIGRYVPIGSGSLVLPGVEIGEGAAVGAMSLVAHPLPAWTIHLGNPAKRKGARSRDLLALEPLVRGDIPPLRPSVPCSAA